MVSRMVTASINAITVVIAIFKGNRLISTGLPSVAAVLSQLANETEYSLPGEHNVEQNMKKINK